MFSGLILDDIMMDMFKNESTYEGKSATNCNFLIHMAISIYTTVQFMIITVNGQIKIQSTCYVHIIMQINKN